MKYNKNKNLAALLFPLALAGCADTDILPLQVEKPQSIAEYEYLNEYGALKSYIDRSAHPGFKLGAALAASEFTEGGLLYSLALTNFDELTAGNAMKFASCVADDGTMDFSAVTAFVDKAEEAGLTVYGHTLAWHSQQNNKYLNSLLKDKELPPSVGEGSCLHINTPNAGANPWDWQCLYDLSTPLEAGKTYSFSMRIKASSAVTFPFWIEMPNAGNTHYGLPQISADTTWGDVSFDITPNSDCSRLLFNFGQYGGDLYFDDMVLVEKGSDENMIANGDFEEKGLEGWSKPGWHSHSYAIEDTPADNAIDIYVNQINNGSMQAGESMSSFIVRESGKADVPATVLEGQGPDGKNCIAIQSVANPANSWDTQFFIVSNKTWEAGESYRISFWYKATEEAGCETQCHSTPGSYLHWQMLPSNPTFTTDWQYYEATSTIPGSGAGMQSIAFNLNVNANAVKYYFADIAWQTIEKGNTIPLTPEEKKDTLTWAMDRWIAGMMNACGGRVTTWDVVNEAIAGGGDDGEGFYPLQSADNVSAEDAAANFYWQDYLGSLDYVRTAVRLARERFAESGGNASDLKLFINDYNLESDWDDNKKLKSLIHWIGKWEADGVTRIDGIASQMHVSCYADAATQARKEEHVVKMLELMAATGKLVKISELDMGYVDAGGVSVPTARMTEEQHQAMAAFYTFIISKYFEIIPANQQYGITQWCITDSPAGSGWRGGEPVGLWDANYSRKHTYAGFADGLNSK